MPQGARLRVAAAAASRPAAKVRTIPHLRATEAGPAHGSAYTGRAVVRSAEPD